MQEKLEALINEAVEQTEIDENYQMLKENIDEILEHLSEESYTEFMDGLKQFESRKKNTVETNLKILKINPNDINTMNRLARHYEILKQFDKSLMWSKKVLTIDSNNKYAKTRIKKYTKRCNYLEHGHKTINGNVLEYEYYKPYIPYSKANQDFFSGNLLDLKESNKLAIKRYIRLLSNCIPKGSFIIGVPSSKVGISIGINKVVQGLGELGYVDLSDCLMRIKDVPSRALTNMRDVELEYQSIVVMNNDSIEGKTVYLIDDIITTGNTMYANRKLLLNSGVAEVRCIALGSTVGYH